VASEPSESWEAPNGSGKSDILLPIAGLHAPFKESTLDRLIETTPPDTPPDRTGCGTERLSSPDSCESIARRDGAYLKSQSFLSVKLLGTGGFSTVDEVVHRETRLRISRKTLKNREQSALEELKKEVNVLQKLRHPHIIRYLGAYSKDDKVSILLSPVAETNLAVWLDKCYLEKPAGLADTVIKMFGCLASSIRYLHEQRPVIKHMDIKPQNILVMNGSHDIPHVVLSDFGISSAETGKLGETATPLTRQYCAPEVSARASRGQAADIWSLGCVFLEMLAAAYHGENAQWLGFRKEFSGRKGKYYWEDVPRLHEWLVGFLDQAANYTEATVLRTVKSMVRKEPVERPSAAMLTILFAPAPCCLSWPNEKASFPAPQEEVELAEMILREAAADGLDDTLSGLLKLTKSLGGQVTTLLGGRDETSSFESAKAWLKDCLENHDACRQQTVTPKALPTRLIDLRPEGLAGSRLRLISSIELPGGSDATYAAISHTWTDQDLTLSSGRLKEMQASLLREQLPKALNDAIAVADRIGHRYIWVDSLCVIQDSAEDKRKECAMMASTYRNAVVTIVADTADTSPGPVQINKPAGNPAHWEAPGFAWDTRPWCLQERLLCGRLLHLTKGQMYWDCHSLKASETFPHGLPSLVWEKVHTRPGSGPSHTGLLSKVTRVEAPAVIRDCKFLKKEGDSIGDAMSAQMQMTLKAHSPSNVGGEEQHRNRNCRRDQAGQPPLCSARTSGHPFCADRLADALDSYRRTSFSPNPSSFLPGDEGFNTITNETENEEKNSKKGTENSKCGCGGLVSRPIEGEDCSSLSLRGSCGRKRCGGGFAGCRGMT
jgi:serine/threonine protein kinase